MANHNLLSKNESVSNIEIRSLNNNNNHNSNKNSSDDEPRGFIGETLRITAHVTVTSHSSTTTSLTRQVSIIAKTTPINSMLKIRIRSLNQCYIREAFFYEFIAPLLKTSKDNTCNNHNNSNNNNNNSNDINYDYSETVRIADCYGVYYDKFSGDYLLLLEDVTRRGLFAGNQLIGGNLEHVFSLAIRYAKFNSRFLAENPCEFDKLYRNRGDFLKYFDWMNMPPFLVQTAALSANELLVSQDLRNELTPIIHRTIIKTIRNLDKILDFFSRNRPCCLIHADARAENILFHPTDNDNWVSVDWQTLSKGIPVYDLAYFVALNVEIDDESIHQRLVRNYYDALQSPYLNKSEKYTFENCWFDYKISLLIASLIPVVVMSSRNIGNDGLDRMHKTRLAMLRRSVHAIRVVNSVESLDAIIGVNEIKSKSRPIPFPARNDSSSFSRHPLPSDENFGHHNIELYNTSSMNVNAYDRWFLNGYSPNGSVFFAVACGFYPGRKIVDASFSIVTNYKQYNFRCRRPSTAEDFDSLDVSVGWIRIKVLEPLKRVQLLISKEGEIEVDIIFTSRFDPHIEPRFLMQVTNVGLFDYERLTQLVLWNGSIGLSSSLLNGARKLIMVDDWYGTRDRSWGIRPHPSADRSSQANIKANELLCKPISSFLINRLLHYSGKMPQFYWLWCPLHLENGAIIYHSQEDQNGNATNSDAIVHFLTDSDDDSKSPSSTTSTTSPTFKVKFASHKFNLIAGTRHLEYLEIALIGSEKGDKIIVECRPIFPFIMSGIGYSHPTHGHGSSLSDSSTSNRNNSKNTSTSNNHYDDSNCVVDEIDTIVTNQNSSAGRNNPLNWHIQEVCNIVCHVTRGRETADTSLDAAEFITKTFRGVGVVEQLCIGKYIPSENRWNYLCDA